MVTVRQASARLILGLVFICFGSGLLASPTLVFHWDRETGTSQAVVRNPEGDVLAEFPWDGALPRRYSLDEEETETPTFLLGQLRDQLETSVAPGADTALAFIRELMGPHADTPVEELSTDMGTWIPNGEVGVDEWCGEVLNGFGDCTEPADPGLQTALCSGFPCKQTLLQPAE